MWADSTETKLKYGLWGNNLTGRIKSWALERYLNKQYIRLSAQFGQKMIIDLAYDEYMTYSEICLLCANLNVLINDNRYLSMRNGAIPFDVHFTNCGSAPLTMKTLGKYVKQLDQLQPSLFHEGNYLERPDLFPRNRLLYLSPHASEPLLHYSPDDIIILGGYNDRTSHARVSHLKAGREGIRCYKLPLDQFVSWRQGHKKLCLNHCLAILQEVSLTGDWATAISKHAPSRKMWGEEEVALRDELRRRKLENRHKGISVSYGAEKDAL
jgi:ribonuclease P protein 1